MLMINKCMLVNNDETDVVVSEWNKCVKLHYGVTTDSMDVPGVARIFMGSRVWIRAGLT